MTFDRLEEIFQQFGKIVRLAEIGSLYASGVKEHATAMHAQFAQDAAGADDFGVIQTVIVPNQQKVSAVAAMLDRVQGISQTTAAAYLRTLTAELSIASTSTSAAILSKLATLMPAASGTIAPGGKFYYFFADKFGFTSFPTNAVPSIGDALVTTTIV